MSLDLWSAKVNTEQFPYRAGIDRPPLGIKNTQPYHTCRRCVPFIGVDPSASTTRVNPKYMAHSQHPVSSITGAFRWSPSTLRLHIRHTFWDTARGVGVRRACGRSPQSKSCAMGLQQRVRCGQRGRTRPKAWMGW